MAAAEAEWEAIRLELPSRRRGRRGGRIGRAQALVGTPQDGIIGPATLKAINAYKGKLNLDLCDRRMALEWKELVNDALWPPTRGRACAKRKGPRRRACEQAERADDQVACGAASPPCA